MSWVKNNEWLTPKADNRIYWQYLRRFLEEYGPFRTRLVIAAVLALVGSITAFLILPIFALIQRSVVSRNQGALAGAVAAYLGIQLFQVLVNYFIRVHKSRISSELNEGLALKYYSKLLNISIEDFIEFKRRSNLFQRVIDAMAVTADFTNVVIYGVQSVIVTLVTMIVIGTISPLILAVVTAGAACLFTFVYMHSPKVRVKHQRVLAVNYPLVSKMLEIIQAIFTIKALTASIQVSSDIKKLVTAKKDAEYDEVVDESRGIQGAQAISHVTLALAVGVSFFLLIQQRLEYSQAFALYVLAGIVLAPVVDLARLYQTLSSLSGNIQNYFQVLDMQDEYIHSDSGRGHLLVPGVSSLIASPQAAPLPVSSQREGIRVSAAAASPTAAEVAIEPAVTIMPAQYSDAPELTTTNGSERAGARGGTIVFDDVDFAYRGGEVILKGLSFEIAPGEKISLIGRSGVGKTTVFRLMMGFLQPQRGSILIDGVDISRLADKNEFRRQFAIVGQQDFFFGTSIRENLLFGLDSMRSAGELERVLTLVNLWDNVRGLNESIDTVYMDELFSGGQKQRFFIARALLRDPSIILLDEPTSALDFENEDQVLRAIRMLMRGRTTITIAHRLSTVRNSDRVLVLHDKQIAASGSHEELYSSNDYYRALCQFNSFIV